MRYLRIICIVFLSCMVSEISAADIPYPVSINFHQTPLRTVLENLSSKTQMKFVFYDELVENHFVTCRFSTRSLNHILNRIILPQGLLYERTSTNVITLYQRWVPPHTWILQGQVFSGDSSYIENVHVSIDNAGLETFTDSQGCFLFMDISLSPCRLSIVHPDYVSVQVSADSSQSFQAFYLSRKPFRQLHIQSISSSIRSMEIRTGDSFRSAEFYPTGKKDQIIWHPARLFLWNLNPSNNLDPTERNPGFPDIPDVSQIYYENIPVLKSEYLNGPCGGFHAFNVGDIQIQQAGADYIHETIRLTVPRVTHTSVSFAIDPWQARAKAGIESFRNFSFYLSGRQTYGLAAFEKMTQAYEDYQQLIRYRTIRPVKSPIHDASDFSSRVAWRASVRDSLKCIVYHSQDRLNTSVAYHDTLGSSESQKAVSSWLGIQAQWQHRWNPTGESQIRYIHSEAEDQWMYDHPGIGIYPCTDRDRVFIDLIRLSHNQHVNLFWSFDIGTSHARYHIQNALKQNQNILLEQKTENHLTTVYLNHLLTPFVLLKANLGGEFIRLSEIHRWLFDPYMEIGYRLREPVTVRLNWSRRHVYLQQIPNQIRTYLPKRTSQFRVLADSVYRPADVNDWSARLLFQRNRIHLSFRLFFREYGHILQVIPFASQSNEEEFLQWVDAFQEGNAYAYGLQAVSEFDLLYLHVWMSYRWWKIRMRFPEFNSYDYYSPVWHRDHEFEGVIQGTILGIHAICSSKLATGLPFVQMSPMYSVTSFGPEYRMQMPSGAWNFRHSPVYVRMDLSFFRLFQLRERSDVTLGISVVNVFNHPNVIGPYYFIESAKPSVNLPQVFSQMSDLPRTAWFYVQYHFDGSSILPVSRDQ